MCGNGAATGKGFTPVAHRPTLKALTMGRTACIVAAAGAVLRGAVVLRTATPSAPFTATTSLVSACPFKSVLKSTSQQVNEKGWRRIFESMNFAR